MPEQICEQEFPAQVAQLPMVAEFIEQQAGTIGLSPKRMMQLQVAVEEVVVNLCTYGYDQAGNARFTVRTAIASHQLRVSFIDQGVPFDPLQMKAPNLQAGVDDRELGGVGLVLIRRFVDEVRYSREQDCNVLTLVLQTDDVSA